MKPRLKVSCFFLKWVGCRGGKNIFCKSWQKPRQLFTSRNLIYHFEIPLEHRAWNFTDKNIKNVSARRGQPPPYRVPAAILISMKAVAMTKKAVTLTFYVIKNTTKTYKIYALYKKSLPCSRNISIFVHFLNTVQNWTKHCLPIS